MMVGAMRKGGMCDMSWVVPIMLLSHTSLIYDWQDPRDDPIELFQV